MNDFSNILEYYMDKYLLKYLSKCRDSEIKTIKKEVTQPIGGSTTFAISLKDNELVPGG